MNGARYKKVFTWWASSTALCLLFALCPFLAPAQTQEPWPGIAIRTEILTNPPMHLTIAEVNLSDPHVHVRVAPGGADPDGPGPWQTILTRPTEIAAREHFDLVINGDFFNTRRVKNPKGGTNMILDPLGWGGAQGPAATDGRVWSTSSTNRPCLVVHKDGSVVIKRISQPSRDDWEVIAGNILLVHNGAAVHHADTNRHPRTCVGLNAGHTKLILLVVDGRKPGKSIGMTYDQLANTMLRLGCREALNLDGGGSAIMAVRKPDNGYRILNIPSDGHERPVADVLGISVEVSEPSPAKQ